MNARELAAILPLAVFVLWVGLYPKPFLGIIDASVKHLLAQVHGKGGPVTTAALLQSILASLPEIVVVAGACAC